MDVGSRSPCSQPVAFLLRRHEPKYRESLIKVYTVPAAEVAAGYVEQF
jgi:hypothetical protein